MSDINEQLRMAKLVCLKDGEVESTLRLLSNQNLWKLIGEPGDSKVFYSDTCPDLEIYTGPVSDADFFEFCFNSKNENLLKVYSFRKSSDNFYAVVERLPEIDDDDDEMVDQILRSISYACTETGGRRLSRGLKRGIRAINKNNITASFAELSDITFGSRNRKLIITMPFDSKE